MKIAIHYFSGCGNTQWVAVQTKNQLTAAGHEIVLMQDADLAFPTQMPESDLDLFIAPVYFGGLPANVSAYYKRLPIVGNRKAIFWSVCGATQGMTNWQAKTLLTDRGYEVIATDKLIMPDTFLFLALSQQTQEQRMQVLKTAQQKITQNLEVLTKLPDQKKDNPVVLVLFGIFYFLYYVFIRHVLGLMMVSSSKCIHCGKCAENCPVHCIQMKDGKPTWHTGCVNCFRCVNNCPAQAIDFSGQALLCGIIGGVIGLFALDMIFHIFFLSKALGLCIGFFIGCFVYTKINKRFNPDKWLLLKKRQRIVISDQEKGL